MHFFTVSALPWAIVSGRASRPDRKAVTAALGQLLAYPAPFGLCRGGGKPPCRAFQPWAVGCSGNLLETRLLHPEPVGNRLKNTRLRPVNTSRGPPGLPPVLWELCWLGAASGLYFGGECRRTGEAERLMSRVIDADTKSVNTENSSSLCFHYTNLYLCLLHSVDFQTVMSEQSVNL